MATSTSPSWRHPRDAAHSGAERVSDAASSGLNNAEEVAELAAAKARELFDSVSKQTQAQAGVVRDFAREHPVAVVAAAFAAGLVVASLRKRS